MDKISFNNSRGLKLIANLYSVGSNKLIIISHGFMNDKSSNGRFEKLSESLNKVNYDTLAIDSRLEIIEGGKHGLSDDWRKVIDITHLWYDKFI